MKKWLNEKDVAELLNISVNSLQKWRFNKSPIGPPFYKLPSGMVRYDADEIDAWVRSGASGITVPKMGTIGKE